MEGWITFDEARARVGTPSAGLLRGGPMPEQFARRVLIEGGRLGDAWELRGVTWVREAEVDDYLRRRDEVQAQLGEARAAKRTIDEEIVDELGLSPERARRLGLNTPTVFTNPKEGTHDDDVPMPDVRVQGRR